MKKIRITKKFLLIMIPLVLLLGTTSVFAYQRIFNDGSNNDTAIEDGHDDSFRDINYGPATDEERQEAEQNKINNIENPSGHASSDNVSISRLWQDESSREVIVQTQLTGVHWRQCDVTFTQENTHISKTAEVIYQPEFSTCAGFAVPINEFPVGGNWKVVLKVTKADGSSTSAEQNITIARP